ncbi:MAG: alpha/beta hydrolase [Leptospiraceae bacterium]|nr:alpha/beta hydrolase [Leptospiraceae bacterium]
MDLMQKHNVHILDAKDSSKGTIIFANGFGTNQTYWNPISEYFQKNYKIIHFENIGANGVGMEHYSPHKYDTLNAYAKDLVQICHFLNVTNAILVTHSVSGMIGLLASNMDNNLFSKLIFLGASPRYLNDEGYVGGFSEQDLEGIFEAMRANYFAWASGFAPLAVNCPENPKLGEYFANTLQLIQPDVAISVAKTIFYCDHRKDLPYFQKPCLILKTKEDIAVPPEVPEYLHKNLKYSQLLEINAKGHHPHLTAPDEVIKALEAYLN